MLDCLELGCGSKFWTVSNLDNHLLRRHGYQRQGPFGAPEKPANPVHVCAFCKKVCLTEAGLNKHVRAKHATDLRQLITDLESVLARLRAYAP